VQCLHLASMAETAAADHQSAADTLLRVVDRQHDLLAGAHRAYVSACAAAAIELTKAGDLKAARRLGGSSKTFSDIVFGEERVDGDGNLGIDVSGRAKGGRR
jgi:hypothetical protein